MKPWAPDIEKLRSRQSAACMAGNFEAAMRCNDLWYERVLASYEDANEAQRKFLSSAFSRFRFIRHGRLYAEISRCEVELSIIQEAGAGLVDIMGYIRQEEEESGRR